jgi:two-component sensor histidine kinase
MESTGNASYAVEKLVEMPHLAEALEAEQFRQFLDHIPFGICVSSLSGDEAIIFANPVSERLLGREAAALQGQTWEAIGAGVVGHEDGRLLSAAVLADDEYVGRFNANVGEQTVLIDAWSNRILDDADKPVYRLVALAEAVESGSDERDALARELLDKDTLLRELQHRVKNNLQMVTALIRLEARNAQKQPLPDHFERLAGRVDALALLYHSLSEDEKGETIDLGVYVSQIASAVMAAHATEGIRLSLKVDSWPVSINAAMPAGLVVNELMTNALKHAFVGRESGEIAVESLVDDTGCVVTVADDGIGLQPGMVWPKPGKLSALIVNSLEQNVKAKVILETSAGMGVKVRLFFARKLATTA